MEQLPAWLRVLDALGEIAMTVLVLVLWLDYCRRREGGGR